MKRIQRLLGAVVAFASAVFITGSGAQSGGIPTVDLSIGPLATSSQAVNIALALSVEFPTAGAAYRSSLTYSTGTTYIGYWDSNGCYDYYDETAQNDAGSLNGQYFYRTGNVDSNGYCNTSGAGTGYSGNMLNWAATSAIDNLRLALTGGNRIVDTTTKTVLGRAYLPTSLNDGGFGEGTSGYWPPKQIPGSLVGKVTPAFRTPGGSTAFTGTVYIKGCQDKIFFGTQTGTGSCANPGNANNLAPYTPTSSTTPTQVTFRTPPADTATTTYVATGQATWDADRSSTGPTTTTQPSGTDPQAGTLDPNDFAVSPPPRTSTVTGTQSTPQYPGDPAVAVTWTITSPVQYTQTQPTTQTLYGISTISPGASQGSQSWALDGSNGGEWISQEILNGAPQDKINGNNTRKRSVCTQGSGSSAPSIRLAANGPSCSSQGYVAQDRQVVLFYKYKQVTQYPVYDPSPVYNVYQTYTAWYVPYVARVYNAYPNGSAPARMNAAVRVCDTTTEATARTIIPGLPLCQSYASGYYKPVGQLQKNALAVRTAAFGYVMDNVQTRYGGVLRAPMKFVGPSFRNTSGQIQNNSQPEWDATTGVFVTDPLNAAAGSPSFSTSGVINYLNKFGANGQYKSYDPVGELWYEALRYFQGKPATDLAYQNVNSSNLSLYGGFPQYSGTSGWTDPIQNACQRSNYILAIGDVNTHYDKQLPGNSTRYDSTDPLRSADAIPGTASTFDASYWTSLVASFETGANTSYTDALGRSQTTAGNTNTISGNANLQSKGTGAGSNSAYFWAGAAYWANTQSIRKDTYTDPVSGRTASMSNIRVKTFAIDVDEAGNGQIDNNPRGIAPRQSSFYLAGKYGWFNDTNRTGNPFAVTANGNQLWEDPQSPNTPDGYVLASQASRMIAGIQKFFNAAVSGGGSLSVSALSSQRYSASSQSGDLFSTSYDPATWSGTLYKKSAVLNQSTYTLQLLSGYAWDANLTLTNASLNPSNTADPFVPPASRNIWTWGATAPVAFTAANLNQLSAAVQTALAKNPATNTADGLATQRINYIRGDRSGETTNFRVRSGGIMGDVINSGPVYKGGADNQVSGAGYGAFAASVANRTPMVYVGANDGMLHGFRASDGKEILAYIPRAVSTQLNKLTNRTNYVHTPFVDGVPTVGEAQVGSNWRTVLAGGMGGGARGVYALDVTFPDAFGATPGTSSSGPLWEFTNADDPMMGHVLAEPKLVKINMNAAGATPNYKWFVAVGSGYNNYANDGSGYYTATGNQALFLLSLDKAQNAAWQEGVNYFKVQVPITTTSSANGLSTPGVLLGNFGETLALYTGDLQGKLWRFDLSSGLTLAKTTDGTILKTSNGSATPLFTASDSSGVAQPITVAPLITASSGSGYMVVVGTGKFMEPSDNDSVGVQAIYSVWDPGNNTASDLGVTRSSLYQYSATVGSSTVTLSTGTFALGSSTGQYKGCYFNLPDTGERVGVQGDQGNTTVAFNSLIPTGQCSGDGNSRSYQFNAASCTLAAPVASTTNSGFLSKPNYVDIDYGVISGGNYHTRLASGVRKYDVRELPVSATTGGGLVSGGGAGAGTPQQINTGRLSWREIKSFN